MPIRLGTRCAACGDLLLYALCGYDATRCCCVVAAGVVETRTMLVMRTRARAREHINVSLTAKGGDGVSDSASACMGECVYVNNATVCLQACVHVCRMPWRNIKA